MTVSNAKPKGKAGPSVSFKEEIAGRETLAAIFEDRGDWGARFPRNPANTKHYGDRISNAPGATSPKTARAMDGAPDIWVSYGSQTRHLSAPAESQERLPLEAPDSPEIEINGAPHGKLEYAPLSTLPIDQVFTFVVDCLPGLLATEDAQMKLVAHRLLRGMPSALLDDVRRVDVTQGEREGTSLVRVWVTLR